MAQEPGLERLGWRPGLHWLFNPSQRISHLPLCVQVAQLARTVCGEARSWVANGSPPCFVATWFVSSPKDRKTEAGRAVFLSPTRWGRHLAQCVVHSRCLLDACCLTECMSDPSHLVKACVH